MTIIPATYAYTSDALDAGYTVTLTNGLVLSRTVLRDRYRRHLITAITNAVDGVPVSPLTFTHDLLDRVVSRNADAFGYNPRSEVVSATISNTVAAYAYDPIGNRLAATNDEVATLYASTPLNQYSQISVPSVPSVDALSYDPDGNLLTNGVWSYTWDGENRLVAAYSNTLCVVSNAYDHAHRRVLKVTPSATSAYLYDGWNLIQEIVQNQQSTITNRFFWGKDLSGSLQGAGGIGGLLAVSMDESFFFPFYDHNGNATTYVDESGATVASYLYDAFGATIAQSGALADAFPNRFSTKYFDAETGLYYYGYRFYSPELGRWLSRDPIGEKGGWNLQLFVVNAPLRLLDPLGLEVTGKSNVLVYKKDYSDVSENQSTYTSDENVVCWKVSGVVAKSSAGKRWIKVHPTASSSDVGDSSVVAEYADGPPKSFPITVIRPNKVLRTVAKPGAKFGVDSWEVLEHKPNFDVILQIIDQLGRPFPEGVKVGEGKPEIELVRFTRGVRDYADSVTNSKGELRDTFSAKVAQLALGENAIMYVSQKLTIGDWNAFVATQLLVTEMAVETGSAIVSMLTATVHGDKEARFW